MVLCDQTLDSSRQIIDRAKAAGSLRRDVTGEDLLLVFAASAALSRQPATIEPGSWRRLVEFTLDGFRAKSPISSTVD